MTDSVRLHVRMASAGIASLRRCKTFIAEGRVCVNDLVVTEQGRKVNENDVVTFDGRPIKNAERKVYVMLNKPPGYLCSERDPGGRPLAGDLIKVPERVFYVGRLDYMSSGLIFYTNDGEFSKRMTHPSSLVEKEYVVTTNGPIPRSFLDRFRAGIMVGRVRYKALKTRLESPRRALIVLTEGKNRELRRVFEAAGIRIKTVHRVRIASIRLGNLQSGRFRVLRAHEIKRLKEDSWS